MSQPVIYNKQKKKGERNTLKTVLDVFIIIMVAIVTFIVFKMTTVKTENQERNNPEVVSETATEDKEEEEKIDLAPVISSWMNYTMTDTKQAVVVYDLDNDRVLGELNADQVFQMESLYKLLVVYEGYRRIENGSLNPDEESVGGKTVLQCLDLAIRESNSDCAENILEKLGGEAALDQVVQREWGLQKTSVSELDTTANDMIKMLKIVFQSKGVGEGNAKRLKDSMLNQGSLGGEAMCEKNDCDLRQGLPRGFSDVSSKVYDKVGWRWDGGTWLNFNDVAIVEYPQYKRNFAIVVLTSLFGSKDKITELGGLVDEALLAYLRYE